MAEAALFSVASDLISAASSSAFKKAYGRVRSIWYARDQLNDLINTITIIQAKLLDAEKKQSESEEVKIWMKRVNDVLYDADDLFDEVTADDMLRKLLKGNKVMKKVRLFWSQLNPVLSNDSIAKRVMSIRKRLLTISEEMKAFNFVERTVVNQIGGMLDGRNQGSYVDSKSVIGREEDKKAIMEMLLHESKQHVRVIAIVGIGGLGKTTLAQLVYNDKEVIETFENRWFACISESSTDTEIYEKIFHSTNCVEWIEGKKCLIVLDDVWDENRARWQDRMNLLRKGAKGSKIIVSTRSKLVARVVGADEIHYLQGLSEEDSWNLFKIVVGWTEEYDKDQRRMNLGRQIVKKCANLPLAIKSTASLLFEKDTIQEWDSIEKEKLPWVGEDQKDGVMPVLKLSYDYLPSNVKHCFAYCSLFPKDHVFDKDELIHLWIAQGYIKPLNENEVVEDTGHSYFMHLLRRSFFEEYWSGYKMHDLMHDLAMHVAGKDSILLSGTSTIGRRHVSVGYDSLAPPEALHCLNQRRSFLFINRPKSFSQLDQWIHFPYWKYLRALKLSGLSIENIPSSIGELKQLRYLDISYNKFKELPESFTKLVNLCTLYLTRCDYLKSLPSNFGKLVSLRNFYNDECDMLKHLPIGFEELNCLQHLSEFKVCKVTDGAVRFSLDGLSRLKLRGTLNINFEDDVVDWDGLECWQPPPALKDLWIIGYNGNQIPNWGNENLSSLTNLTSLCLIVCTSVKCLPSFEHIPNLRILHLSEFNELEYIQEEALFIPSLEDLDLCCLPKLKGWSRKECSTSTLAASLTCISIFACSELSFNMPMSETTSPLNSSSSSVEYWSFPGNSLTSLRKLKIFESNKLKKVELPPSHLNQLEVLSLKTCPELELWEENKKGVDWDSIPKLRYLYIDEEKIPSSERLPYCLRRRQELGELQIKDH